MPDFKKIFAVTFLSLNLLLSAGALVASASDAPQTPASEAAPEEPAVKVKLDGYRKFKWKDYTSSGNTVDFQIDNGFRYLNSRVEQASDITLSAQYPQGILVNGKFTEIPYQDRSLYIDVNGKNARAQFGDFSAAFPGAKLTTFSKSIRGIDVEYNTGPWNVNAIMSQQKSQTKTQSFTGRNIRGPYKLNDVSIVEGSEVVRVDGVAISPMDYTIDFYRGEISFSYNIDPSNIVEITYESELLLEFKTASVTAFGVSYSPKNSPFDTGISMITEGANSGSKTMIYTNYETLNAIVIGQERQLSNGLMEKNTELLKVTTGTPGAATGTVLTRSDYSIDYTYGTLKVTNAIFAGAGVSIEYKYYNTEFVREMVDEEIRGLNQNETEFILSRSMIYSGTEIAYLYLGSSRVRELTPDVDYKINETRNSITFLIHDVSPEHYVKISYRYVRPAGPGATKAQRNIYDAYVNYNPSENLGLEFEAAKSESDLSTKTIHVVEEYVATVSNSTVRLYSLDNKNAIATSVEVFFDDTINPSNRKTLNSDFTLESDPATSKTLLRFSKDIPVGTTIIANYKYTPTIPVGNTFSGNSLRTAAKYKNKRIAISGELISKDAEFAPVNAYNDLSERRFEGLLDFKLTANTSFTSKINSYDQLDDLGSAVTNRFNEFSNRVAYKSALFPEISFFNSIYTADDNQAIAALDHSRIENKFVFKWNVAGLNKLTLDTALQNKNFDDKTGNISDRDSNMAHLGVIWKPGPKLSLDTYLEQNNLKSKAPAAFGANASYKSNTLSKSMNINYLPNKIWTLSGNMLLQAKNDSRPAINDEAVDSARISLSAVPFKKFSSANAMFYRRDMPDNFTGGSRSDTFSSSFGYDLTPRWNVEPSFIKTITRVSSISNNNLTTRGLMFRHNRLQKGRFWSSLSFLVNDRDSVTNSVASSSDENQYIAIMEYVPGQAFSMLFKYDIRDASPGTDVNIATAEMKYKFSKRFASRVSLSNDKRSTAGADTTKNYYVMNLDYEINETFSLKSTVERQSRDDSASALKNYTGTIYTMEFNINF